MNFKLVSFFYIYCDNNSRVYDIIQLLIQDSLPTLTLTHKSAEQTTNI